jgi:hypothetical protein
MDSRVGGGAGRQDAGGKLTSVVRAVDVMTPSRSDKGHGATLPNRLAGAPAAWEIDAGGGETDGRDRHIWEGVPTLLLTTTGRRAGRHHRVRLRQESRAVF